MQKMTEMFFIKKIEKLEDNKDKILYKCAIIFFYCIHFDNEFDF